MERGTRLLTGGDGESYQFDPSSFCLELLLTGGPGPYERYEILRRPEALVEWLGGSRLARRAPLLPERLRIRHTELRRITEFRDAMFATMFAVANGGRPSAAEYGFINENAEAPPRPELDPATGTLRWAAPVTGTQVLGAAARDAIELVGERADRLRECRANDCRLLFLDTSRPGARRWCSMQRCGNRNKVKAYRARQD
ncbi:hypothetical protein CFN78_13700 [Amycolatopsis antarctica]|uniref:Zinc finger CGNR domain-containing protein n=1 Tax=Amycolatopsis antarctica TaxID=1854586 RepID=A0A263D392_9PSEU|nr:CGNR zinc finger domain-containing protein [Amycolatopsis antarctica]OZM72679.1 hypothetical protein CFN78_13700 [Amycolatopsis antarctica]